jgi:hypothetical protein
MIASSASQSHLFDKVRWIIGDPSSEDKILKPFILLNRSLINWIFSERFVRKRGNFSISSKDFVAAAERNGGADAEKQYPAPERR